MAIDIGEYESEVGRMDTMDMIRELAHVKRELEAAKEIKSTLEKKFDAIRLRLLPNRMEEEGLENITVAGAGRVNLQGDLYFSIPADTKFEAFDWLREHGHGDIIQETVNSSTGKAWAKEVIKSGEALPDSLFRVTPFTRAQITLAKG